MDILIVSSRFMQSQKSIHKNGFLVKFNLQ